MGGLLLLDVYGSTFRCQTFYKNVSNCFAGRRRRRREGGNDAAVDFLINCVLCFLMLHILRFNCEILLRCRLHFTGYVHLFMVACYKY